MIAGLLVVALVLAILVLGAKVLRFLAPVIVVMVGVYYIHGALFGDTVPITTPKTWAEDHASNMPETQARFCQIIGETADAYDTMYTRWENEQSVLTKNDLEHRLAAMRDDRDIRIYTLLKSDDFAIASWRLKIESVSTNMNPGLEVGP